MSFFASLSMVIWGSKNKYCLSFGFIFLGISIILVSGKIKERMEKELIEINDKINEVDIDEDLGVNDKVYILKQLYVAQKKSTKNIKRGKIVFLIGGICMILLGIFGMF